MKPDLYSRLFVTVVFCLAISAPLVWAQEGDAATGTVTDSTGRPLAGVRVTLGGKTWITDGSGVFRPVAPAEAHEEVAREADGDDLRTERPSEAAKARRLLVAAEEEITVTGSFLASQALEEGAQPIAVLERIEWEDAGAPDFEETIRNIPQMYGHVNTSNQYTTSTLNAGQRGINLRGFGTHRNLVLLNGRRAMSGGYGGAQGTIVDVGAFPKIALQRVEILKEATPLYGSDAITGVFNYLTDATFTGLTVEVWHADVDGSDGGDSYAGVMKGWDIGPLHLVTSLEYSERDRVRMIDRDWFMDRTGALRDGSWPIGNSGLGNPGSFIGLDASGAPSGTNLLDPSCGVSHPETGADSFPLDGAVPLCSYYYTHFANFIDPQTRLSLFNQFTLDTDDGKEVYGHLLYTRMELDWATAPSYPPTQAAAGIGTPASYLPPDHPGLRDFVGTLSPEQAAGFAGGAYYVGRTRGIVGWSDFGRHTITTPRRQEMWQLASGLRGTWELDNPIHYDFSVSYGTVDGEVAGEDVLRERQARANVGLGGPDCDPNTGVPGQGDCYYWNPFYTGWTSDDPALRNRQDVWEWMSGPISNTIKIKELHFYANFSGDTGVDLAGGPLGWAAGYEYDWTENSLLPSGHSFTDSDLDPSPYVFLFQFSPFGHPDPRTTESHSVFGELLLPLTESFELNVAARYTDVPWFDDSFTKGRLSARWSPVDHLVLRGSFSQGVLVPSIWDVERVNRTAALIPEYGESVQITTPAATDTGGLEPEEADTWNLGFVFRPFPRLAFSLDAWTIDFKGPILTESETFVLANKPEQVILGPTGVPVEIFTHRVNGPDSQASGFDFGVRFDTPTPAGLVSFGLDGTLLEEFLFEASEEVGSEVYDAAGRYNVRSAFPLVLYAMPELKVNLRAEWRRERQTLSLVYRYVGGFDTHYGAPWDKVDEHTSFDAFYSYLLPGDKVRLKLSGLNLGDEAPPVVLHEQAFDSTTHSPLGRVLRIGFSWNP